MTLGGEEDADDSDVPVVVGVIRKCFVVGLPILIPSETTSRRRVSKRNDVNNRRQPPPQDRPFVVVNVVIVDKD